MAFPTITATSVDVSGAVPARSQGDLVLLIAEAADGSGSKDLVVSSLLGQSWSQLGSLAGTTASTSYLSVAYLIAANAGSSTTVTVGFSGSGWSTAGIQTLVISGAHKTTPPEVAFATGQNPPSLDPVNWATEDTLWIAVAARYNSAPTTSPTSYTTSISTSTATRVAYRALNAASDDPAAFSGGTGNGSAATLAIRPAPPQSNAPRSMHYAMQGVR